MTPQKYQTEAIILQELKFGEADKILTLYSPHQGKLKAIAKGVRRPRSQLRGQVALLNHSLVQLAPGRNLDIVSQAQVVNSFMSIKDDLRRLSCGIYVVELVSAFTPERLPSQEIFDLLRDTLHHLCHTSNNETLLSYFELHLLDYLGYRPQLHKCVACNQALKPVAQFFSPSQGGILCPECGYREPLACEVGLSALKVLRLWQSCDYATAARVKADQQLCGQIRQLMKEYINYLIEKEVKSLSWLERLSHIVPPSVTAK